MTKNSLGKVKKLRLPKYLNKIRGESCIVCGSPPPVHAHHLRHSENRGMGQKVSDNWTVPLCWQCHGSCHTIGREANWWEDREIDPIEWADRFYSKWREGNE